MTKRLSTIILIGIALIGGLFYPDIFGNTGSEDLEVHFIDVGQGDCILIKGKEKNMLIDAGSDSYSYDVINYIASQGIYRLDYVVGTHPHEDHIGSLDDVIDYFDVGKVILPEVIHTSIAFENLLDSIEMNDLSLTIASPGDSYDLDGAKALILAPLRQTYGNLNNYSVVIKLINGENSFLFTGDAEHISENEMLDNDYRILKSDVLKLGHHGSSSSSSEEFLRAVNPDYGVILVGERNSYGHPHWETLDVLEYMGIKYFRTDLDGNIIFRSNGEKISIVK